MQDPIDVRCLWPRRLVTGRKAGLKSYGRRALAQETRPMAGGKRGCFVQEEQLGPAAGPHDVAANAAPLQRADQPRLTGPAAVQQCARQRIMDDAPIPREHPALWFCDDVPHGCDAILQRHGLRTAARASSAGWLES